MKTPGYQIVDQHAPYFLTFTVVYWIDAFTRPHYKQLLTDSLTFYQNKIGLQVHAYVIMSNQMHLIVTSPHKSLSDWIRDYKRWVSRKMRLLIQEDVESRKVWMYNLLRWRGDRNPRNDDFQFWVQDNCPKYISTRALAQQKIEYIHQNPVKAQLVYQAEDYVWSSAQDYAGRKGPIDVDVWMY
ncbi:MAG: transposase [Bacteroidota bacterium]